MAAVPLLLLLCPMLLCYISPVSMNTLYYGDNLKILREHIASESVDLIYLDPPFNSNRSYNVPFKNESGKEAESQITAFKDTWHWDRVAEETSAQEKAARPSSHGPMATPIQSSSRAASSFF